MRQDILYTRFAMFYEKLYRKNLDGKKKNLKRECDIVENIFLRYKTKKIRSIIDIGCGTGIHTHELAKRKYKVVGVDLSNKMLRIAKKRAKEKKVIIKYYKQNMQRLSLRERFDSAIFMCNAFLYNTTNESIKNTLSSTRKVLTKNGILIIEVSNYLGKIVNNEFSEMYIDKVKSGKKELIEISVNKPDLLRQTLNESNIYFYSENGKQFKKFEIKNKLRLFTTEQMKEFLGNNGFELLDFLDFNNLKKATPKSTDYIIVARRL